MGVQLFLLASHKDADGHIHQLQYAFLPTYNSQGLIRHPDRFESEPRRGKEKFTTGHPNWEEDIGTEWGEYSKEQFGANV
jgi:hypothetical protein